VQDKSVTIQDVFCGPTDTALVLSDGRCFVSGANKHGQLGLGHTNPVLSPKLLPNIHVQKICLGPKEIFILLDMEDRLLTEWGN
jgi:alpha-tubulin suppressor-like RCC1 family protein